MSRFPDQCPRKRVNSTLPVDEAYEVYRGPPTGVPPRIPARHAAGGYCKHPPGQTPGGSDA